MTGRTAARADDQKSEIEITSEMIQAGAVVLADEWGVIGELYAGELASEVFRRMMAASVAFGESSAGGVAPRSIRDSEES